MTEQWTTMTIELPVDRDHSILDMIAEYAGDLAEEFKFDIYINSKNSEYEDEVEK